MLRYWKRFNPGDNLCNVLGIARHSDHRQILRTFVNMFAVASALALLAYVIWL